MVGSDGDRTHRNSNGYGQKLSERRQHALSPSPLGADDSNITIAMTVPAQIPVTPLMLDLQRSVWQGRAPAS